MFEPVQQRAFIASGRRRRLKNSFADKDLKRAALLMLQARWMYGPMGHVNSPRFIEVVQSSLRYVGSRWAMPEYMISSDASNNNFCVDFSGRFAVRSGSPGRSTFLRFAFPSRGMAGGKNCI